MKKIMVALLLSFALTVFISQSFAQDSSNSKEGWRTAFIQSLEAIRNPEKTDGLGYTLSEEEALEQAIQTAMDNEAPACEALKEAVDRNFNPYNVLSGIFKSKAPINLNQLCMCATETGDMNLPKSLMLQAANAAVDAGLLTRDEVTQAQCLEQGLGFTPEEADLERGDQREKPDPYSKTVPG